MVTKVRKLDSEENYWNVIREAAACLAGGGLVVFPTETVYGVGACATNPAGLAALRELKQRPVDKPFTVHIGSRSGADRFVPDLEGPGRRLITKAWPGPLTVVFRVADVASAPVIQEHSMARAGSMYHDGTIGIRCPDDRSALDLLTEARLPVVAASANAAGAPAAVDADEALVSLDGRVDLVLDGGRTRYAKPSTVVRVDRNGYEILREGVLEERTIHRLVGVNFLLVCSGNTCRSPMAEALFRRLLAEKLGCREDELAGRGYHVESAGVWAGAGTGPSDAAIRTMRSRGMDIAGHRSQALRADLIDRADYVFTMTSAHTDMVVAQVSEARARTRRVGDADIEDPIGGDDAVYARCADSIEKALRVRLEEIAL